MFEEYKCMKWTMWNFNLNLVDVFIGFWLVESSPLIIICVCVPFRNATFFSFHLVGRSVGSVQFSSAQLGFIPHFSHNRIFTDSKKTEEIAFPLRAFLALVKIYEHQEVKNENKNNNGQHSCRLGDKETQ